METLSLLAYLQTALLVVIPLVGAAIAWRQMKLAEMKVKHDLFDRRFAIYEAAANFLARMLQQGNVSNAEIMEYSRKILDAEFLLNDDASEYLSNLRQRANAFHMHVLDAERPSDTQQKAIEKKYNDMRFFEQQFEVLRGKFRPFLRFEPRGWHGIRNKWFSGPHGAK